METWIEEHRPELLNTWLVNWRHRSGQGSFIIVEANHAKVDKVAQKVFEEITGYVGVDIFDEDEPRATVTSLYGSKIYHRSGA